MTDSRNAEEMHRAEQAFAEIFAKAIELGGTITGEHGVGAFLLHYESLSYKLDVNYHHQRVQTYK
ncbi:FAD-linked oxidase C-terminal domain-containing protein [Bacillus sp. HC-TM]